MGQQAKDRLEIEYVSLFESEIFEDIPLTHPEQDTTTHRSLYIGRF